MLLKNKVALISGATSGTGKAIALLFAAEGAGVVVNNRNEARGAETVAAIQKTGGDACFILTDVSQATEVESLVADSVERYGKLDILVPNSGELGLGSVTDVSLDTWDQTIGTNLNGVFYLCRYAIPHMIEAGGGSMGIELYDHSTDPNEWFNLAVNPEYAVTIEHLKRLFPSNTLK